ncbi:MAG: hypothetical protein K0Q76_1837 [Panacagrimonas sp.]|jgi:hypothetical protein|nr:hypothetical protein [Panacagrimonas sp.]MCC2656729.1 hypothetical protein [Panacagrimonas sp.]
MFRQLDADQICTTAEALQRRVDGRFPGSGLGRVAGELLAVARETQARIAQIRRPHWALRIAAWGSILALAAITIAAPIFIQVREEVTGIFDLLQGLEAGVNNLVFVAIAVWFLYTFESRPKRKAALAALHELRSIAHIIDMHQLAKDPEDVLTPRGEDVSTLDHPIGRFELSRYLDYCSEMLSITSKLAALYAQDLNDSMVLDAVDAVETLTGDLSAKIWQKIMILDVITAYPGLRRAGRREPHGSSPDTIGSDGSAAHSIIDPS